MPFDGTTFKFSTVTQALIDGRDQIKSGWASNGRAREGVCAIVALAKHSLYYETYEAGIIFLRRALKEIEFHSGVPEYNDTHTKEEAIALYNRAIELSYGG